MKKFLLSIFGTAAVIILYAQIKNIKVSDCNSHQKEIYKEISSGKVLIIVSSILNCQDCIIPTTEIGVFADENTGEITVWGAMKPSQSASCKDLTNWMYQNSWSKFYTFIDTGNSLNYGSLPNYTVIDPRDSTVAYEGNDFKEASEKALRLKSFIREEEYENEFEVVDVYPNPFKFDIHLNFSVSTNETINIQLFDIVGKQIHSGTYKISPLMNSIDIKLNNIEIDKGVYLLRIERKGEVQTFRLIKGEI